MKKVISFSKELNFPTMIGEISSISLENNLSFVDSNKIEGKFIISGTYKMTEASRIDEDFNYTVPIEIDIEEELDIETTEIDIDDFTYEIVNEDTLLCKIDVLVEGLEIINVEEEVEEEERACDDEVIEEELDKEEIEEVEEPSIELNSLFSNLNDDSFKSYTVYIVREKDTIESIVEKYHTTKEALAIYNNLDDIFVNSKLIIPTNNED